MKTTQIYTIIISTFLIINLSAQVGIGTDRPNPQAALDIAGITNVTKTIILGGNDTNLGDDGGYNNIIISGGNSEAPKWTELKIPAGYGDSHTVTYMNTFHDRTGIILNNTDAIPYNENEVLDNNWKVLTELNNSFTIHKANNKINYMFQSVAQINSATTSSFACGLFINSPESPNVFRLKGVRTDVVIGNATGNYKLFNMKITLENLATPAGGNGTTYNTRIACRGRSVNTDALGIGKPVNTEFLNQDMAQSTLNVFVLED